MTIRRCALISRGCLLAAAVAAAQGVAPVAPVAPVPPAAPAPAPMPAAAAQFGADSVDWNQVNSEALEKAQEKIMESQDKIQEKMAEAQQKMALAQQDMQLGVQEKIAAFMAQAGSYGSGIGSGIYGQAGPYGTVRTSADAAYSRGQSALDRHRWDEALTDFSQAASQGGSRADGALYWKAYTLNKLGRRDDALAAVAELRKSYPSSRWLEDANALELEVKQASGQPVSPDAQSDEDLKLMALNGLMQSDPDHALTALDGLLKSGQSPKLKEQALFVLAQNNSPKAQQMLEQVARGSGNPDLQLKAISFLGPKITVTKGDGGVWTRTQPIKGQTLSEIYESSNDVNVKRAVLNALSAGRDTDHLLQIAKTEKDADLRRDAFRRLTGAVMSASLNDALVAAYGSEQDQEVKRTIANAFVNAGNVKQLVAVAKTEKDPEMVRYIVSRLANMKSPEAADYLMEIIKK
jgi:tetratricopeptide (TPR) repeat protein